MCRVEHEPALPSCLDEARAFQPVEMKRQRIRRHTENIGDLPGRLTLGTLRHQMTEYGEPGFLAERGQGFDDIQLFHISTIIEITTVRQASSAIPPINLP